MYKSEDRTSFMVELTLVNEQSAASSPVKAANELSHHLLQRRHSSSLLDLPDIIDPSLKCSLLSGMAGIGKSSTVENLALCWAKRQLGSLDFDFVFLFSCRNFFRYQKKQINAEKLFLEEFNVNYRNLNNVDGSRVLIIFDGLDEVESLSSILKEVASEDIYNLLREMIKEKSSIFPGHTTLLVGRPHVLSTLKRFQMLTGAFRVVQILGFTKAAIQSYVGKFSCNDILLQQHILQKIFENTSVKAMARIPQLLCSICSVYSWETKDLQLEKKSELFLWTLLSFLRHHFPQFAGLPPNELLSHDVVSSFILIIAKLSYELLKDNRIIFDKKEVKELETEDVLLKRLLETFLAKVETFDKFPQYQFRHLIIEEFFAAVHCFVSNISACKLMNKEFYEITEFLAGLVRGNERISSSIVSIFAKNILKNYGEKHNSFRKRAASIGRKKKHQSVAMIAEEVFLQWKQWKISCDVFCSVFYELFDKDDTLPKCIQFNDQFDVLLSSLTSLQVVRLNHFLECMSGNGIRGLESLRNLRLCISSTDFSESGEFCNLFCSLTTVKDVRFVQCTFRGKSLDILCTAILTSQHHCPLSGLSFRYCNLSNNQLSGLTKCASCLGKFSLVGELVRLDVTQRLVNEILRALSGFRCYIRELELRDCKLDGFCFDEIGKLLRILETVNLSGNVVGRLTISNIIQSVGRQKKLEPITHKLKTFVLRNCGIDDEEWKEIQKLAHLGKLRSKISFEI